MASTPVRTVRAKPGRAHAALALAIFALMATVVFPPLAWLAGAGAIVLGADARQRARRGDRRGERPAAAALVIAAVAIAVGTALVLVAIGAS